MSRLQLLSGRAEISSLDPALASIRTAYASQPLAALSDPPVELTAWCPCGGLHFNRWVNLPAVSLAVLTRIKIGYSQLEHGCDSERKRVLPLSLVGAARYLARILI
jgi:hypothetical protein